MFFSKFTLWNSLIKLKQNIKEVTVNLYKSVDDSRIYTNEKNCFSNIVKASNLNETLLKFFSINMAFSYPS